MEKRFESFAWKKNFQKLNLFNQLIVMSLFKDNWVCSQIKNVLIENIFRISDYFYQEETHEQIIPFKMKFIELFESMISKEILNVFENKDINKNIIDNTAPLNLNQNDSLIDNKATINSSDQIKILKNLQNDLINEMEFDKTFKQSFKYLDMLKSKTFFYKKRYLDFQRKLTQLNNFYSNNTQNDQGKIDVIFPKYLIGKRKASDEMACLNFKK